MNYKEVEEDQKVQPIPNDNHFEQSICSTYPQFIVPRCYELREYNSK